MNGELLVSDIFFTFNFLPRCSENAVVAQPISTSLNVNIYEKDIQNVFLPKEKTRSRFSENVVWAQCCCLKFQFIYDDRRAACKWYIFFPFFTAVLWKCCSSPAYLNQSQRKHFWKIYSERFSPLLVCIFSFSIQRGVLAIPYCIR